MDPMDRYVSEVAWAIMAVCETKADVASFEVREVGLTLCGEFGLPVIQATLDHLVGEGYIRPGAGDYFISPKFLSQYGNLVREKSSLAQKIPASDRIVTLNHNQSDYQQAVEALDKVLEEFRNDHRLDNELGHEKDAYLKVLEGGRKALEDKEISVENGQNWIVAPLKWIAEKFADGALKVLAVKALEAIAKLF